MHAAVKVICHPTTGKSKGFGFVKFSSQNQAAVALQKMNGQASVLHYLLSCII
jgi:RNA recognition motif-containing protein